MGFDITKKEDRDAYSNILKFAASQKGGPVQEIKEMQDLLKEYGEAKGILNVFKRRKIKKQFENIKNKFDNASHVAAYMDTSKPVDNNKSEIYSSAGLVKAPEQSQYGSAQFARTYEYAAVPQTAASPPPREGSLRKSQENHQRLPEAPQPSTIFKPTTPVAQPTPDINYGKLPANPKQMIYQTLPPEQADKSNYQPFGKPVHGSMTQKLAEQAAKKALQGKVGNKNMNL